MLAARFVLLIFSIFTLSQVDADSGEEDEKIITECMEKTGVKIEEVKNFQTDKVYENIMCFMKCRYEKSGWFDENGRLIKETLQERYEDLQLKEEQQTQIDQCLDKMKPVKECSDLSDFFGCIPVINFSEF